MYDSRYGTYGVSVCAPGDQFNRKKGVEIAAKRAFVAHRMRESPGNPYCGAPPWPWPGTMADAVFDAYNAWGASVELLNPANWVGIPNSHLPRLLTVDQIERGEFLGYDYYELAEAWGVHETPVEDALRSIMRDEICQLSRNRAPGKVTSDLRAYVRALANRDDTCSTMLWCGLSLIEDDETFVKYCDVLLECMWR